MGIKSKNTRNYPLTLSEKAVILVIVSCLFYLFILGFGFLISKTPDSCLKLVEKTTDEKITNITYGRSFLEGSYCLISTNKDIHTIYDSGTCIKNKIGTNMITVQWENFNECN